MADVTIEALDVEDLGSFHACAKCETANSNLRRVFQKHNCFVRYVHNVIYSFLDMSGIRTRADHHTPTAT